MAKRRRKTLEGVAHSIPDLKSQAKSCGSHYFDPSTLRYFNAKPLAVFPVQNRDVTYFVEARGGGSRSGMFSTIPRHYVVGMFKDCSVSTIGKTGIGETGTYKTAAKAKKVAKAIANKAYRSSIDVDPVAEMIARDAEQSDRPEMAARIRKEYTKVKPRKR